MEPMKVEKSATSRLKKFLYYGTEDCVYKPGNRRNMKCYEQGNVPSIEELLSEGKASEIDECIKQVHYSTYSANPEAKFFALALCLRLEKDPVKLNSFYSCAKLICTSPEDLFSFASFMSLIRKPNSGWGSGFRKTITHWYKKQEALELVENVTKVISRHNWSHKDICKCIHLKFADKQKSVVLTYILKGLDAAIAESDDECEEVINYLKAIKKMQQSNVEIAARIWESNNLKFDHIPSNFLCNKEIWVTIIPRLPIPLILANIRRLARLHFLKHMSPLVPLIDLKLRDQEALARSKLHPAEILIHLKVFESSGNPYVHCKVGQPVSPPNPKVVEAVNFALHSSFSLLQPTGKKFIITIDNRLEMNTSQCWQCQPVLAIQAAMCIALTFLKSEKNGDVKIISNGINGYKVVEFDKGMSFDEAIIVFKTEQSVGTEFDLAGGLQWALNEKKPCDVFISITDNRIQPWDIPAYDALLQYRQALNMPNTKFVACGLSCGNMKTANSLDAGMLDICGFSRDVAKIITAFAKDYF